jgi:hypothetical protein
MLAYDKPKKTKGEGLVPSQAPDNLRYAGKVPRHSGQWQGLLTELGCTIDYIRFLSPALGGTPYLRMRMEKFLPPRSAALTRVHAWPAFAVRGLAATSRFLERAIPVDPRLTQYLASMHPDVMVVTPLVLRGPWGVQQTQIVKAAQRLGIPVVLAVGSWDHLSSKGFIRVNPDIVLVWNETQKREAVEMHGVSPDRIVVTGAQAFDQWFTAKPSLERAACLQRVGLPPSARQVILYVGSSRGIASSDREIVFVRQWLSSLRASRSPEVRQAAILIRPHPFNMEAWQRADLSDLPGVSIWPRRRPSFPMDDADNDDYFHSLFYSDAVVGINTSAMIEASIVGRQVYTVQLPEFASTQKGTTHFHYLVPEGGGCVTSAETLDAHVEQLSRGLLDPDFGRAARQRFVADFVRPTGFEHPAVLNVANAIERAAMLRPRRVVDRPLWLAPVRLLLGRLARHVTIGQPQPAQSKSATQGSHAV